MINIKELVKDNKQVHFAFYKDGELWYRAADGFLFPVPISDVGGATMLACDKALLFMRYMRKHAETLEGAKECQTQTSSCSDVTGATLSE